MTDHPFPTFQISKTGGYFPHDSRDEHDQSFPTDKKTDIDYEIAGRREISQTFKDLRSGNKARRRLREEKEKYYHYKGVNRGQIGKQHYVPDQSSGSWRTHTHLLEDAETTIMTKSLLYREAQHYPRPPTYHRNTYRRQSHWVKTCAAEKRREERRLLPKWILDDVTLAKECEFQFLVHGLPRMICFCDTPSCRVCEKPDESFKEYEYPVGLEMREWWEWYQHEESWEFNYDVWDVRKQMCDKCEHFPNKTCEGHEGCLWEYRAICDELEEYLSGEDTGVSRISVGRKVSQSQQRRRRGGRRVRGMRFGFAPPLFLSVSSEIGEDSRGSSANTQLLFEDVDWVSVHSDEDWSELDLDNSDSDTCYCHDEIFSGGDSANDFQIVDNLSDWQRN